MKKIATHRKKFPPKTYRLCLPKTATRKPSEDLGFGTMRKINFAVIVAVASVILAQVASAKTAHEPSRLGVKGRMVFIVTDIAHFAGNPEIKARDMITSIYLEEQCQQPNNKGQCGPVISIQNLQNTVASSKLGSPVQVEFQRINSTTGKFDHHATTLNTFPHPAYQSRSALGLMGKLGLMVTDVDPSTEQGELHVGDIILSTPAFGSLDELDLFRNFIKGREPGSIIKAEVLRFNSAIGTHESVTVSLKLFPYPPIQSSSKASSSKGAVVATSSTRFVGTSTSSQNCPESPCRWCCAGCCPYPWSSGCCRFKCETGMFSCSPGPDGRRCIGDCA